MARSHVDAIWRRDPDSAPVSEMSWWPAAVSRYPQLQAVPGARSAKPKSGLRLGSAARHLMMVGG